MLNLRYLDFAVWALMLCMISEKLAGSKPESWSSWWANLLWKHVEKGVSGAHIGAHALGADYGFPHAGLVLFAGRSAVKFIRAHASLMIRSRGVAAKSLE